MYLDSLPAGDERVLARVLDLLAQGHAAHALDFGHGGHEGDLGAEVSLSLALLEGDWVGEDEEGRVEDAGERDSGLEVKVEGGGWRRRHDLAESLADLSVDGLGGHREVILDVFPHCDRRRELKMIKKQLVAVKRTGEHVAGLLVLKLDTMVDTGGRSVGKIM